MITRVIPVIFLCFTSLTATAQTNRPADFDYKESDRRFANLLKFPEEVKGKVSLMLSCMSQIRENGRMDETGCYQMSQYEQAFASSVIKAAKKARLNPAIVNGKPAKVYLQFRVEFLREAAATEKEEDKDKKADKNTDDGQIVHIYLNPGYEENVLAYGFEHIAGQRVIGKKEAWTDACPSRAQYSVWARAYLSEEGKAESPTIEFGNGIRPVAACLDAIKKTIISSQYTPAMADGMPVPSTYIEAFSN